MEWDKKIREHILYLLKGGGAHIGFEDAVSNFPKELRGKRIAGLPHTAWDLLEHMRIAQWDILEFSRNPRHISPGFPQGYWPKESAPVDEEEWNKSITAFRADCNEVQMLVSDPSVDLIAPIPHGTGQTILREALLVSDHTAYHLGQMLVLRRILGCWRD